MTKKMNTQEFNKMWAGRTFQCQETGKTFVIPDDVYRGNFFYVGNGFVDVGDEWMHRIGGNVIEIKLGEKK